VLFSTGQLSLIAKRGSQRPLHHSVASAASSGSNKYPGLSCTLNAHRRPYGRLKYRPSRLVIGGRRLKSILDRRDAHRWRRGRWRPDLARRRDGRYRGDCWSSILHVACMRPCPSQLWYHHSSKCPQMHPWKLGVPRSRDMNETRRTRPTWERPPPRLAVAIFSEFPGTQWASSVKNWKSS
jgi:hypothetical protein